MKEVVSSPLAESLAPKSEEFTGVIHGISISDPFRWLEDQNSTKTREWLKTQAEQTKHYFEAIEYLDSIRERVAQLSAPQSSTEIWSAGENLYFLDARDRCPKPVLVRRRGLSVNQAMLIDPAELGDSGRASLGIVSVSFDERFLAFCLRKSGTDSASIRIFDLSIERVLRDHLFEGHYGGIVFARDGSGFYYVQARFRAAANWQTAVFFHRFGTHQSRDRQLLQTPEDATSLIGLEYSPDIDVLAIAIYEVGLTRRTSLYLRGAGTDSELKLIFENLSASLVPFFINGELFGYTDLNAPNFRIVRLGGNYGHSEKWSDIVPESNRRIQQFAVVGDAIFFTRVDGFSTSIEGVLISGNAAPLPTVPPYSTVTLLNRGYTDDLLFFGHTSLLQPPKTCCFDVRAGRMLPWDEADESAGVPSLRCMETRYESQDGTHVPVFIAVRKDLAREQSLPTFMTSYGGFGACVTPRFTTFISFLLEQGFVVAIPAVRGGSELGESWHRAGIREKRQNSFNDFIAAAEWLVQTGRADPHRIAVAGGSNAALLVGAAITQRPDLFRAAICLGPLFDMVRYHLFDFAAGWSDEYGCSSNEQDLQTLLAYSPYHRVLEGVSYPAVLTVSGDADSRCNPMHARKMTARLQAATASQLPVLLDYGAEWGHTPVLDRTAKTEGLARRLAFICNELGIEVARGIRK